MAGGGRARRRNGIWRERHHALRRRIPWFRGEPGLLDGTPSRDVLRSIRKSPIAEIEECFEGPGRLGRSFYAIAIAEAIASRTTEDEIDDVFGQRRIDAQSQRFSAWYDVVDGQQEPMIIVVNQTDSAVGADGLASRSLQTKSITGSAVRAVAGWTAERLPPLAWVA